MSEDQTNNVLKFPAKQRDVTTAPTDAPAVAVAVPVPVPLPKVRAARSAPPVGVAVTFAAIALATVAANRYAYRPTIAGGDESAGRVIASAATHLTIERDAAWEKALAERLAAPELGAKAELGRDATLGERLRFADLEDKYAVGFDANTRAPRITSITLGRSGAPLAVDRSRLLSAYGSLFEPDFARAELKSVNPSARGVTEIYELKDGSGRVRASLAVELDRDQRLLSVANAPVQI